MSSPAALEPSFADKEWIVPGAEGDAAQEKKNPRGNWRNKNKAQK